MRDSMITLTLLVAAVTLTSCMGHGRGEIARASPQQQREELPERDEINETYQLRAGARVEVKGINGTVKVEASDSQTAEVHVRRAATSREALADSRIIIEQKENSLTVRTRHEDRGFLSHLLSPRRRIKQEITLVVPRESDLNIHGVNGSVTLGEMSGPVLVKRINGPVELSGSRGEVEVSGVNGPVGVTVAQVIAPGVRVKGINGPVELRFGREAHADLRASGINGGVESDAPHVTLEKDRDNRASFSARVGAGGAPVTLNGINGGIRLRGAGAAKAAEGGRGES